MIKNEELFFDGEARRLIDSFALCFKINISIFSSGMDEIMAGFRDPNVRFCQLLRKGLQSRSNCCQQASLLWEYRESEFESMVYSCHRDLAEAVMPVKLKGILLGYALIGQFRTKNELNGGVLKGWINAGLDAQTLRTAFEEHPFFDKKTLESMLRLFSMLLSFLVTREYVKIRQPGLAESVSHWLEIHISESLDLNRIAVIMNRSRSTISHTIKRQLGMSFKELCILKRIQRFENIIAGDPGISIREAAALAGYRDPFYFSRIYKKVRLAAPSAYLKSIRKKTISETGDLVI
jgi:AraC-like DNA-binding protein